MADDDRAFLEEEEEEKGEEQKRSLSWLKYVLYGVGALVLLILMAVISYFTSFYTFQAYSKSQEETGEVEEIKYYQTYSLGEFKLNLDEPGVIAQVTIDVAFPQDEETLKAELEKRTPQIIDGVHKIIATKSASDLQRADFKEYQLKTEIKDYINSLMTYKSAKVEKIFFDTFIVLRSSL